nr:hypothetical protein [uncultured Carboxylicivirga sp.]
MSCTTEYEEYVETLIVNKSGYNVRYIAYEERGAIVLELANTKDTSLVRNIEYDHSFPFSADSIQITFNNERESKYYLEEVENDGKSPYSYDEYIREEVDRKEEYISRYTRYTYTITEEDYNNAISIE